MLQNPFQARASKVSSRQWDSQISSSVLHSRALIDLQIHKPLYLITDSPSYGYSSFPRSLIIDNPFYSSRSALEDKYENRERKTNPFLTATPYRYQPTDISAYSGKGLASWERQAYLERPNELSESAAGVREGKEQLKQMRNMYSFEREGRELEEDMRDPERYPRQMAESNRQPAKRTDQAKTFSNTQKAPTLRKDSLRLDNISEPVESVNLKAKFSEYERKMSNHQPDSPRGWPREQYTTIKPAVSSEQNGFRKVEMSRQESKDTRYVEGSSIINKLQNIPESRETNSLQPNIRMTDSKVYEFKGGNDREFRIPEDEEYEGFDFNSGRFNEPPQPRKELYETSKFKAHGEREIPPTIRYRNTVFELVATY